MSTKIEERIVKLTQLKNKLSNCTDNQKAFTLQQEIITILKETLKDKEIMREIALKSLKNRKNL